MILIFFCALQPNDNLVKSAVNKAKQLKMDVQLSDIQYNNVKNVYITETMKIDSLKYLPQDIVKDPKRMRAMINEIKANTNDIISKILTSSQVQKLKLIKEKRKHEALQKINITSKPQH
ncbi:MAG: hypothetical protein NW207_00810 [Cytophagales bacterium]|nr:hypothetical protein [Cytophagales bacterium]